MGAASGKHFVKAVFRTPAAMADEAAGFLIARGALGCSSGGSHRPGAKQKKIVPLEAFFDRVTSRELRDLARAMSSAGMLANGARPSAVTRITDPGWSTLWMERFRPLRVGRRFLIVPPWSEVRGPKRLTIVIKPARAFGTGHHATTAGVLRAVERLSATRKFRTALDVGTGSGVLAIAMKTLGAEDVLGIDNDPQALENARENAALNRIRQGLRFSPVPISRIRRRFDLVVANILASTLISLAPALKRVLARDGVLVLAGILAREVPDVLRHYAPPLRSVATATNRGWATLVLAR